jgi:hypothetical protein
MKLRMKSRFLGFIDRNDKTVQTYIYYRYIDYKLFDVYFSISISASR